MKYVNVYGHDREYGGPEEGGWWFDTMTPVEEWCRSFSDEILAWAAYNEVKAKLDAADPPTYGLGSVLYCGGVYSVLLEDEPAKRYPEVWPRYE